MKRIKERSRLPVTFQFRSSVNGAVTPSAVRYRIDCLTTRRVVREWTALTPAKSVSIVVSPDENAIIDDGNRIETKSLTVIANPDTDAQFVDGIEWEVENRAGLQ